MSMFNSDWPTGYKVQSAKIEKVTGPDPSGIFIIQFVCPHCQKLNIQTNIKDKFGGWCKNCFRCSAIDLRPLGFKSVALYNPPQVVIEANARS